jgi:hypothetical protein
MIGLLDAAYHVTDVPKYRQYELLLDYYFGLSGALL